MLTLPYIVKGGERAVNIGVNVFPRLHVKAGVHPGDLPNDDPVSELCDLFVWLVGIMLETWSRLKADWTHVMVPAVVNVGFLVILQAFFQFFESCLRVYAMCSPFSVQLEGNARLTLSTKELVEKVEPQD